MTRRFACFTGETMFPRGLTLRFACFTGETMFPPWAPFQ